MTDTATQSRIAAQSRLQSSDSNIDDLEEFLPCWPRARALLLMTMRAEHGEAKDRARRGLA
jgi:hypothetical protein